MQKEILFEEKIRAVKEYLKGNTSQGEQAQRLGIKVSSFQEMVAKYETFGEEGLRKGKKNNQYSAETNRMAIESYLNGEGSQTEICKRYKIRSKVVLRKWIQVYNGHRELRPTRGRGSDLYMTKGRNTTYEERVEIVSYCIEHGNDYTTAIEKYGVSYQQIYPWVRKYKEKGAEGLVDKRGKRKPESEMTELEKLRAENRMLEARNKRLETENAVLKKSRKSKGVALNGVRQERLYLCIQEMHKDGYAIAEICDILDLNRSSYYKWTHRDKSKQELENEALLHDIGMIYAEHNGTYGYRRIADEYNATHEKPYNLKRFYRLVHIVGLLAVIRRKRPAYQRSTPEVTAENVLNREFTANAPHTFLR